MNLKRPALYLVLGFWLLQSVALAQSNPRPLLITDGTEVHVEQLSSAEHPRVNLEAGYSYCCETYKKVTISGADLSYPRFIGVSRSNIEDGFGLPIPFVKRGQVSPQITYVRVIGSNQHPDPDGTRVCVMPTLSGIYSLIFRLGLEGSPLNNQNDIYMRCRETTLFGGFNTSATDFNFLEIRNITDTRINGSITALSSVSGQPVFSNLPFSVNGGRRIDIDIHSVAGSGSFGPLKIVHDGPYGSLQAQVVQYNLISLNPLNFAPVAQEVLRPRQ